MDKLRKMELRKMKAGFVVKRRKCPGLSPMQAGHGQRPIVHAKTSIQWPVRLQTFAQRANGAVVRGPHHDVRDDLV